MKFKFNLEGLNPYFIGLSTLMKNGLVRKFGLKDVSILILLDYLLLSYQLTLTEKRIRMSQSLFYWIIYSYNLIIVVRNNSHLVSILILLDYLLL